MLFAICIYCELDMKCLRKLLTKAIDNKNWWLGSTDCPDKSQYGHKFDNLIHKQSSFLAFVFRKEREKTWNFPQEPLSLSCLTRKKIKWVTVKAPSWPEPCGTPSGYGTVCQPRYPGDVAHCTGETEGERLRAWFWKSFLAWEWIWGYLCGWWFLMFLNVDTAKPIAPWEQERVLLWSWHRYQFSAGGDELI